jgi:hypothetical protein
LTIALAAGPARLACCHTRLARPSTASSPASSSSSGQRVRVPVDPVALLVLEHVVDGAGDQRDAELAQVLLVALEHPVERLGGLALGVLRHGATDLLLRQPAAGGQQADDEVQQAFGAVRGHRPERYPSRGRVRCTSPGPVGRVGSARVDQVDHEDQGLPGGDGAARTAVAVRQVGGDGQLAPPATFMPWMPRSQPTIT